MRKTLSRVAVAGLLVATLSVAAVPQAAQERFERSVTALTTHGFALEKRELQDAQGRYWLRLNKAKPAAEFLLQKAAGSADPQSLERLSEALQGLGLELEVKWAPFMKGTPGSVAAYLLPKPGRESSVLGRLMQAHKIAATLDYDTSGTLKRIALRPLDEKILKGESRGRLLVADTALDLGSEGNATEAFRLHSGQLGLSIEDANGTVDLSMKDLVCGSALDARGLGARSCRVGEASAAVDEKGTAGRERNVLKLEGLALRSRIVAKDQTVQTLIDGSLARVSLLGLGGGTDLNMTLSDLKLRGEAGGIPEALYRQMLALAKTPPADSREALEKLKPILPRLFAHLLVSYRVEVGAVQGHLEQPALDERTDLALRGLRLGLDWRVEKEMGFAKSLSLDSVALTQRKGGHETIGAKLDGASLGVALEGIENVLPDLMRLMLENTKSADGKLDKKSQEALQQFGLRLLQHGMTLRIDPARFRRLEVRQPGMTESLGETDLQLRVQLMPNKLDPRNPMAPMLALASLQARGHLVLGKKDLEKILPLLDPGMQAMARHFVRYEGEKARFDLRFDQGNLLINGKPLQ